MKIKIVIEQCKALFKKTYGFNEYERDNWICEISKSVKTGTLVLDVGAGSSPYRKFFSHCTFKTHDFAQLQPGQLRQNAIYTKLDYVSDICNLPIDDSTFDLAICTEVIEHVPEPVRAVHEIARILKKGGMVVLTAPLGSGLHQEPYHFYGGYTPYWYKKFLTEAGFTEIKIDPNCGFFCHYGQESLRFIKMLSPWKSVNHLLWAPLWFLYLPFILILPLFVRRLDRLDNLKGFTVGYHVTAKKA